MATAKQLADFRRRQSGSTAPATPVKDLPKMAEVLAVFATTEERRDALAKLDSANEDWRKALGVSIR